MLQHGPIHRSNIDGDAISMGPRCLCPYVWVGRRVPIDKVEGFVKDKLSLGGARAPLFRVSAREVLWK